MRRVKFRVGVGRVSVPAPPAAEHHVTPGHRALVHLSQVHGREVDLERALVAERLEADVALDPLLAGGRVDVGRAQLVVEGRVLPVRVQGDGPAVAQHRQTVVVPAVLRLLQLRLRGPAQVERAEGVLLLGLGLPLLVLGPAGEVVLLVGRHAVVQAEGGRYGVALG